MQGIYAIVHVASGRRYIGSSTDVSQRLRIHRWNLDKGTHENGYLQRAWDKYGAQSFTIALVEEVFDVTDLLDVEQRHLDREACRYNICAIAGKPPSPRGRPTPVTFIENAKKPKSAQHRARISAGLKGHVVSNETRARQSARAKARPLSAALLRQQMSAKARAATPLIH